MSRRCCCLGDCGVFSDDFDAPHPNDLSANYTTGSGTWATLLSGANDVLGESGTSGAAIWTLAQSKTNDQHVNVDIITAVGDKHRVLCNVVDGANYHFVQIEQNAGNTTVKLYKRTTGGNVLLQEDDIDQIEAETGVSVCINDVSFTVSFNPTPPGGFVYHCSPGLFPNGRKAGIGNGGTTAIEFDAFTLENFSGIDGVEPADNQCCHQQCLCIEDGNEYCIGQELLATITAFGGCDPLDGATFDLDYAPSVNEWNTDIGGGLACHISDSWTFGCNAIGGKQFTLENNDPEDCLEFSDSEDEIISCAPFVVVFPSSSYITGDPAPVCTCCDGDISGSFFVTITER